MANPSRFTDGEFSLVTSVNSTHKFEKMDTDPEKSFIIKMTCTDQQTMRIYNKKFVSSALPSVNKIFEYNLTMAKNMVSTKPASILVDRDHARIVYQVSMFGVDDTVVFKLPPLVEEGDRNVNELRRANMVMRNEINELKGKNNTLRREMDKLHQEMEQLRLDHRADIRTLHSEISEVRVLAKMIRIYMNFKQKPMRHFNNLTYWPSPGQSESQATKNIRLNTTGLYITNALTMRMVNTDSTGNYGVARPGFLSSCVTQQRYRAFACEQDLIDRWAPFAVDPKVFQKKSLKDIVLAYSQVEKHRNVCQRDIDGKKDE